MKKSIEKIELAERLRKHRKRIGLTQEHMANELGVDRSAYAYYEAGRSAPQIDKLVKISNMFGVQVDELLGNSEKALKLRQDAPAFKRENGDITSGWLTQEERKLVVAFRKLRLDDQEKVCATIKELDKQGRAKYKTSKQ